jgi:L-lactate utilization protein LutB
LSFFDKIFKKKKGSDSNQDEKRGAYMPDVKVPIDEKFTINFKKNGGKFLYCDTHEEVSETLSQIIQENDWQDQPFFLQSKTLAPFCDTEHIPYTHVENDQSLVFFTSCEYLIAQNGAILVCENQLGEKKLNHIPENIIVYATTSQLVDSISDGLKQIKRIYKEAIPANITTLKNFKNSDSDKGKEDFLSYGSAAKNLYLILLEDL